MPPVNKFIAGVVMLLCVLAVAALALYFSGYVKSQDVAIIPPQVSLQKQGQLVSKNVSMVLGIVGKISGQEITIENVKIRNISTNIVTQAESPIIAIVGQSTVMERLVPRDSATISNRTATSSLSSNPFSIERINMSSVNVGDMIAALSDGDVSRAASFTALRINVQAPVVLKTKL